MKVRSGQSRAVETGSPQGSGISPILANVFLHYAFDAWVHQWRQRYARGQIVVVRYADDGVIGAEYLRSPDSAAAERAADWLKDRLLVHLKTGGGVRLPDSPHTRRWSDAQNLLAALRERLAKFGLALNEGKTRLIEFGRFAAQRRAKAGLGRPETFNFLGFTHYEGEGEGSWSNGRQAKRMVRKLKELRAEMRKRWHVKVPEQYAWLSQVLRGHYGYYGLIFNYRSLNQFYQLVKRMWFKALTRRSQTSGLNWNKFGRLLTVFPLPQPTIRQSWYGAAGWPRVFPEEPGALTGHARICGGESQQWLIYPTHLDSSGHPPTGSNTWRRVMQVLHERCCGLDVQAYDRGMRPDVRTETDANARRYDRRVDQTGCMAAG